MVSAPLERDSTMPVAESLDPNASCTDRGPAEMDVIGAGGIRVMERAQGWSEQKLALAGATYIHPLVPKTAFQYGSQLRLGNFPTYSLAVSDDWVVVGTGGDSAEGPLRGSVRLFRRSGPGGAWSEQSARVRASPKDNDFFGIAVALSGNTLLVGAPSEDSGGLMDSGAVYVYELTDSGASLVQRLESAAPNPWGWFGASVAMSSDWIVVGAPGEFQNTPSSLHNGAVHVYRRSAGNQVEPTARILTVPGLGVSGYFGYSVAVAGNQVVVGAPGLNCPGRGVPTGTGAVHLFSYAAGEWQPEMCIDPNDSPAVTGLFGWSVALNASALVVGAPFSSGSARGLATDVSGGPLYDSSGSVFVFRWRDGVLQDRGCRVKAPNADAWDDFGDSVALADDYFAVGAPYEDGRHGGVGTPDEQNRLMDSGGVYIYAMRVGAP